MQRNHRRFLYAIAVAAISFVASVSSSYAALKDTDVDGVIDEAEANTYHIDAKDYDTDEDGFDDGIEIVSKANPLDAEITPLTVNAQNKTTMGNIITMRQAAWTLGFLVAMITVFFFVRAYVISKKSVAVAVEKSPDAASHQ